MKQSRALTFSTTHEKGMHGKNHTRANRRSPSRAGGGIHRACKTPSSRRTSGVSCGLRSQCRLDIQGIRHDGTNAGMAGEPPQTSGCTQRANFLKVSESAAGCASRLRSNLWRSSSAAFISSESSSANSPMYREMAGRISQRSRRAYRVFIAITNEVDGSCRMGRRIGGLRLSRLSFRCPSRRLYVVARLQATLGAPLLMEFHQLPPRLILEASAASLITDDLADGALRHANVVGNLALGHA